MGLNSAIIHGLVEKKHKRTINHVDAAEMQSLGSRLTSSISVLRSTSEIMVESAAAERSNQPPVSWKLVVGLEAASCNVIAVGSKVSAMTVSVNSSVRVAFWSRLKLKLTN